MHASSESLKQLCTSCSYFLVQLRNLMDRSTKFIRVDGLPYRLEAVLISVSWITIQLEERVLETLGRLTRVDIMFALFYRDDQDTKLVL